MIFECQNQTYKNLFKLADANVRRLSDLDAGYTALSCYEADDSILPDWFKIGLSSPYAK